MNSQLFFIFVLLSVFVQFSVQEEEGPEEAQERYLLTRSPRRLPTHTNNFMYPSSYGNDMYGSNNFMQNPYGSAYGHAYVPNQMMSAYGSHGGYGSYGMPQYQYYGRPMVQKFRRPSFTRRSMDTEGAEEW